jgi:uncharacterized protein (UPF0248 family)
MEIEKQEFEDFLFYLKLDGLGPFRSERLWKKKILKNFKNDDNKTIENYIDFIDDRENSKNKLLDDYELDRFDYSIVINKKVSFGNNKKTILRYIDAGSYLHIFYDDKTDEQVSKEWVRHSFNIQAEDKYQV